ncbi:P5.6 [Mulberry crinivirus]|nr:P5.6 [Mulberry crinivirus]
MFNFICLIFFILFILLKLLLPIFFILLFFCLPIRHKDFEISRSRF